MGVGVGGGGTCLCDAGGGKDGRVGVWRRVRSEGVLGGKGFLCGLMEGKVGAGKAP